MTEIKTVETEKDLSNQELLNVNGGDGFAYDLGWGIRILGHLVSGGSVWAHGQIIAYQYQSKK